MRLLVTGGSGFVGGRLLEVLAGQKKYQLVAATRRAGLQFPSDVECSVVGELSKHTDWSEALKGVDVVIHTAARVHVMSDHVAYPLAEFRRVNVEGTVELAKQALSAGVKRFIFLSSIKVNGEQTTVERPFRAGDTPDPQDPYGVSKYEAEQALLNIAKLNKMDIVIIRPVLIYGPGVKANFRSMMRWVWRGVPLPFGAVENKRSLVSVDNLVDLISRCLTHPAAANQVFLVSDGEDLSTTQILRKMADAFEKPARLIPVPTRWLEGAGAVFKRRAALQRLCGSLTVDITETKSLLDWQPAYTVEFSFKIAAQHFLGKHDK